MTEQIGKYRILQRIGRGGMGTVFKADDPVLDRLVALKVISSDIDATEELKARFYREAQACAKLNHPNVVTVHDLGEDQDRLFIVMEFLEGEELKLIIAQRRDLPVERKLGLMVQVCDGLYYAHQKGVIHRDMKPANIFVLRNGQAKILDFGIARLATAPGPALSWAPFGTCPRSRRAGAWTTARTSSRSARSSTSS
jgi:eukaryotic-like serine/threonine-protein kinase